MDEKLVDLATALHVPLIELSTVPKLLMYVIMYDPSSSWRTLIRALDEMEMLDTADKIRKHAEPLTGW